MCKYCFEKEYFEFKSELEYDNFSKQFDSKIVKTIQFIKTENSDSRTVSVYKCKYCKQSWWLSDPDNHWRGYFLKEQNARNWMKKNLKDTRSCGCVILIVILLIIFIKSYFK